MSPDHISRLTLEALVENVLPALDRRAVEAHVTTCAECQARLAAARQMTELLHALPRERPAPNLAARINAAVAAQSAERRTEQRATPRATPRATAAASWGRALLPAAFVVGLVLLALSVPQWSGALQVASIPTGETLTTWWAGLLADPALMFDSLAAWIEQMPGGAAGESSALLTLATLVLAVASLAELGQLLGERPRPASAVTA